MRFPYRYFNLAAAVLACCMALPAQTHYKSHVWVGGHAGVSLARVDFAPSVPQGWLMGSTGGVTFRYAEEKLFGLQVELNWCTRGWKEDFEEAPLSYRRTLTCLTLPVLTQINFGGRRMRCFVNLGPEFSYTVATSISSDFDYLHPETAPVWPERQRMTEQLGMDIANKFDYGITAGIGGEFYVTPRQSVTLEARYYFGLGNIFPSSKADTFSASRCTSIEVTLGYFFRLK